MLGLALLVSGPARTAESEWAAHIDAGESAYRAGDYRAASARFEAALREAQAFADDDPRLATTLNNLAVLHQAQGRHTTAEPLYRRALEIREKTLGPNHEDVGQSLNNLAFLFQAQGLYVAAEPLYQRSLEIQQKALGMDHPDLGTMLNNLAALYQAQARYTEAEPLYLRSLKIREIAMGPDHEEVGRSLNNLAFLHRTQGRYPEAESLYRRSLGILEKALGQDHPDVGTMLNNLAYLYQVQARYAEAEALYRRSIGIREKALGSEHPAVGLSFNDFAVLYAAQGRYAEAEALYRRALGIVEKALSSNDAEVATMLNNLAGLYQAQARYAEAELLYRRSLEIREKALGPDHPGVGRSLNDLAALYQRVGRYAEAEPLHRRALGINEKALGPDHPEISSMLDNLASVYQELGRFAEPELLYQRSLRIVEKALGQNHPAVGATLHNLAGNYLARGRYAEAEPLYLRSLAIQEKALGPDHPRIGVTLNNLALLYKLQGRYAESEPLYRRTLEIDEKMLGTDHPSVGTTLNNLAGLYQSQGKMDEALALARRASGIFAERFAPKIGTSVRSSVDEQRKRSGEFAVHVSLLAALTNNRPQLHADATQEGFDIAQLARASSTADQVAKMAARYAAGSDALAHLARKRQDALARIEQLDSRIVQAAGQHGNETLASHLRAEEAETRKAIANLDILLEGEFPQYRELTNPMPLKLAAAQMMLAEDEALALLLVWTDESFLWVLRRGEAGFFKLALKRGELVEIVKKLRAQLDLGAEDPERVIARTFDVATAHELYLKILGPAEKLLTGVKQLILIPDGAMQSLPPGVLVTEPPVKPIESLADHAQVAWLAKKYAITVLPAAGSLRALRQFAKAPASREPFGGFGDPVLEGTGDARRRTIAALYSRGAVADANEVRKLARLPESAGELRAIAAALSAPTASIRLGSAATERAVKEADLTRYRNLAFATHGLMAGDFKGLAEPALVLTPPEKGSDFDDGLLTASEISQLKLDADWVILSACNTAAPDGTPGAEGLSGLTKAFFYAGARSLLVSHWAVSSDAAVALTTRMFEESAKGTSKAEALRRSMLALMARTDKPYFAHPAFWAPFVLVGEGGSISRQ